MRQILFRAKRLDNGQWVEGLPLEMWWYRQKYLHICKGVFGGDVQPNEVDPTTLCQFTGKLDTKKQRLWSGDRIEATLALKGTAIWHYGYIVYNEDLCCYCSRNDDGDRPLMKLNEHTITRLGSIHDGEVEG